MPAASPRINTVLEPPLYRLVARLARAEGVSLSQKARDLIRDSLELVEDEGLEMIVERRRKAPHRWITHAEMKRRFGLR